MTDHNSRDGLERMGFLNTDDSHVSDLRTINEVIKGTGAYLTEMGIHEVLSARQSALARQARLQWSLDITQKILMRAGASPYAEQDTLPQIISDWFEVILYIQNQTTDFLSDDDVVFAVAEYYDNYCGGDADLLRGKGADRIIKNFKMKRELSRGAFDTPGRQNRFDDEEAVVEPEESLPPLSDTFRRNIFAVREPPAAKHSDNDLQADTKISIKTEHPEEKAHELLALFQRELACYVGDGASSVSERAGRSIFASVRYTVSLCEDKALSLEQRFYEGQKKLLSLMEEAETDLRAVLATRIHIPLDTYYGTLTREIPSFFRLYDAQYAAHETPGLMDYPLALEIENLSGIVYIREYLRRIRIETEYAHRLPDELCTELLLAYGRKYDMDIRPVPVNLFEILMGQAFAAALVLDARGKSAAGIWETAGEWETVGEPEFSPDPGVLFEKPRIEQWLISPIEYAPALTALAALSLQKQKETLHRICGEVCKYPQCSGTGAVLYAREFANRWISHFLMALENRCPENLLLFPPMSPGTVMSEAPGYFLKENPMPDEDYAQLVDKLNASADAQIQHQLIRANVKSRKDLLDLLQEDFWIPGEREAFLATFSSEEQALFAKEDAEPEPELGQK